MQKKKLLILLLGVLMALPTFARDFTYTYEGQTLTYTVISEEDKTVKTKEGDLISNSSVYFAGNNVSGTLIIPETVKDGDTEYSVISIGYCAFSGCSGLTEVIIGNSVQTIGNQAFKNCSGLKKVAYPKNLSDPFGYVFNMAKVAYNPDGAIIEDGFIFGPDKKAVYYAPLSLEGEYIIPNSVQTIGEYAFKNCSGLTEVIIPNSVQTIGEDAFKNCSGLTEVIIGNSVQTISGSAFYECSGLTEVIIGNSVQTIGDHAFCYCSGLTEVIIPNSVRTIGHEAFYGCYGMKKGAYPQNLSNPFRNGETVAYNPDGAIIEDGFIFGPDKKSVYYASLSLEGEYVIPESVQTIDEGAFSYCSGLTSVAIPESVETIGKYAFSYCSGLTSVTIPESTQTIGEYAFSGCNGLTNVNVSWEKPVNIEKNTFSDDTYSTAMLSIPGKSLLDYISSNWWNFKNRETGEYALKDYTDDVFNYLLICNPDDPQAILVSGNYSSMTAANIPERFTDMTQANPVRYYISAIGPNAFKDCKNLKEVNFHSSSIITKIGFGAFENCTGLKSISLPKTVGLLGDKVFSGCTSLTSVTIPESVTSIGEDAFNGCNGLTKSEFASVESLCSIKFGGISANPLYYTHRLCIGGKEITDLVIPESVTSIGVYAFSGCSGLKSVNIPNSVQTIGVSAFYSCIGLTEVTIPNSVQTIGESAFYGCSGLTTIEIPKSVETIYSGAFNGCSNLKTVNIEDGKIPIIIKKSDWTKSITKLYMGRPIEIKD